jgi:Family of unknown function (DUF5719)
MSPAVRRYLPAVVVLVALAAVAGAMTVVKSGQAAVAGASSEKTAATLIRQVAIGTAIRACPPGADGSQDRVVLYASSSGTGGSAALAPLPQNGVKAAAARPSTATAERQLSLLDVPATGDTARQQGSSVTATGAMAQGVEAEVASSSGMASIRCGEPGSDVWFIGPGQQDGAGRIQLDLMNVDALAATVDLNVITDAGVVQPGSNTGITVPPHQLVTQSLATQANGASVVAVEVRTAAGRVAADVSESSSHGSASWLPAALDPSTRLVVPGVPPSGTSASLFLVVPGSTDAKVNVVALTAQGRFRPFGSQSVDLPGQSASDVQLTPLGGNAAALLITSNVPVTAAVLVPASTSSTSTTGTTGTTTTTSLGTFTAATAAIDQQAVIAGNVAPSGTTAEVALSAPAAAARVRLTEIAEGSRPAAPQTLTIPSGRTVVAQLKAPRRGAPFTVVLTPLAGSGPLYAARIESQSQGGIVSIVPAVTALTTTGLPPVRESYWAIAP